MTPTPAQLADIAEALYRINAPRYGNDIREFRHLGDHEVRQFTEYARVAVTKWEAMREAASMPADG